jgi:alpha-beta hydrolase superfamily lysophospholipase
MHEYVYGGTLAIALATVPACAGTAAAPSLRTEDGFTLAYTLDLPAEGPAPLVVLGHQLHRDRRSWDPLVPELLARGYAVMRMDHRGLGESTREVATPAQLDYTQKLHLYFDYLAAIDAAEAAPGVDASRVAILAAGLSVNAAAEVVQHRPGVEALALLSPVRCRALDAATGRPRRAGS